MDFSQKLEQNECKNYSLNFLLAEFDEIEELERDLKIIETKISSFVFDTNDFRATSYYKNISSCFSFLSKKNSK